MQGDTVNVYAEDVVVRTDHVASGSAGATSPPCTYSPVPHSEYDVVDGEAVTSYRDHATGEYVDSPGPGVEQYMIVNCGGDVALRWVPPPEAIDPQALINTAVSRVRAVVPAPAVDISPPPDVGAPANFGLWLAVDDPGQINVVAQAGSVWAGATARFQSIRWDMGNGDVVECDGLGTPIVDPDTDEQGPCGYTYRRSADIGVRQVTVTGIWSVELVTSFSGPAMLDPATSQRTFDYEVFEIQAVGEPG
ncbi:hypothetical protein [Desertimonas flava]|uniref:hypothetical protein n=1 Tax=Desertimonas flava TaxID=2064846 RepID=UPI0013C4D2A6|nr:hypothetical protein [Desertimonas flava]